MSFDHSRELDNRAIGWRNQGEKLREEQRAILEGIDAQDAPEAQRMARQSARDVGISAERHERRVKAAADGLLWLDVNDLEFALAPRNQELINEFRALGRTEEFGGNGEELTGRLDNVPEIVAGVDRSKRS